MVCFVLNLPAYEPAYCHYYQQAPEASVGDPCCAEGHTLVEYIANNHARSGTVDETSY